MTCIFFVKKGYQPWGKPRRKFYSQVIIHCRSSKYNYKITIKNKTCTSLLYLANSAAIDCIMGSRPDTDPDFPKRGDPLHYFV